MYIYNILTTSYRFIPHGRCEGPRHTVWMTSHHQQNTCPFWRSWCRSWQQWYLEMLLDFNKFNNRISQVSWFLLHLHHWRKTIEPQAWMSGCSRLGRLRGTGRKMTAPNLDVGVDFSWCTLHLASCYIFFSIIIIYFTLPSTFFFDIIKFPTAHFQV